MNRRDGQKRRDGRDAGTGRTDDAPETSYPAFAEPWQAQAFALVESLRERGLLDSDDWTAALARALEAQDPARGGHDYHDCWLAALEALLAARDLVAPAELDATAAAWQRAAHATPHGQPILLENDPESGA